MPVHRTHDTARPQPPRADELPTGVPATDAERSGEVKRDASGRVTGSEAAKALAAKARGVKRGRTALSHSLGLDWLQKAPDGKRYLGQARSWSRAVMKELADSVGGGVVGPAAASLVTTAAYQLAASRFLADRPLLAKDGSARDFHAAQQVWSNLANDSRQNLLTAFELAARAAEARTGRGSGAPRLDVRSIDVTAELLQLQELFGKAKADHHTLPPGNTHEDDDDA